MHALQYEIVLPADYDMGIIRKRVAERGHLLDAFEGLGLKAYLIRERGTDGSPVNAYAPFYLWRTPEGMNSFLWGPGFQGIVRDFGRPVVQHWMGVAYEEGPAAADGAGSARWAVRERAAMPQDADPRASLEETLARPPAGEGLVAHAVAVDPRHWELVRFSLWASKPGNVPGEVFQVLHVSAPERESLTRGPVW